MNDRTASDETTVTDKAGCQSQIAPSVVMKRVKGDLAARGLATQALVRDDDVRCIAILTPGWARSELSIENDGTIHWEGRPGGGHDTDPWLLARFILRVLAPDSTRSDDPELCTSPGASLKSVLGRALDARGLDVRLTVYQDIVCYEVEAQIVVANLEQPERGQVRLSDNADIAWEWSCRSGLAGSADGIARTIAGVLADAANMAKLR